MSDAILNKRYHRMTSSLNWILKVEPGARSEMRLSSLRQAQRQWLSFRDKECGFLAVAEHQNKGGEIKKYMCLIDQAYDRANKLSEYINCPFRFLCPLGAG